MRFSFIIPAKNEEAQIGATIESILRQPEELVKEIIVVDNNSADKTAEVARRYPKVRVFFEPKPGTNLARQNGLEAASGDIIAFIDADNWLVENWCEIVTKYLKKPNVAGVNGPYIYREVGWFARLITFWGFILVAYPAYLFVHYILKKGSIVLGGNFAAKREALLKVGGLDTRFTFYGDDVSTGKRLRKVGRVIFTPELVVLASARRFKKRGYFKTIFRYFMNFAWVILFDKPFTQTKPQS